MGLANTLLEAGILATLRTVCIVRDLKWRCGYCCEVTSKSDSDLVVSTGWSRNNQGVHLMDFNIRGEVNVKQSEF